MKKLILLTVLLTMIVPFAVKSQQQGSTAKKTTDATIQDLPAWAQLQGYKNDSYVYFQDYYTFYSPGRGYIYWDADRWATTKKPPVNMSGANLGTARIQMLRDVSLDSFPERNFSSYRTRYPGQRVNGDSIPAPDIPIQQP
ncbi:hypothetical protein [Sediminibacterium ginsengisoli]|uniref:Uncharacterized protein n=1 Tax=Sediminibacterium ginsengisoli TaxID=413434 RepID=A0A1T4RR87_9BACT|nr:hypothetical protein [Sediminibacterium ginsengisoli]SKA18509.1 hypothetical protein SAMN04488132_11424 [Sediminibacterium ginsengisoli]